MSGYGYNVGPGGYNPAYGQPQMQQIGQQYGAPQRMAAPVEMINPADVPKQTKRSGNMPKNPILAWLYGLRIIDAILLAFAFALVIVAITFGILWKKERDTFKVLQSTYVAPQSTCSNDPTCILVSDRIMSNRNNDPTGPNACSNLYRYACGGYIQKNFAPDPITGETSVLTDLNARRVNELLRIMKGERANALKDLLDSDAGLKEIYQKMLNYYNTCVNSVPSGINAFMDPETPFKNDVGNGTINFIMEDLKKTFPDGLRPLEVIKRLWRTNPILIGSQRGNDPFATGVLPDGPFSVLILEEYTPSIKPVVLLTSSMLPASYYGAYFGSSERYSRWAKGIMTNITTMTGADVDDALTFERSLNITNKKPSDVFVVNSTWPSYTLDELNTRYGNIVKGGNWAEFFQSIGVPAAVTSSNMPTIYLFETEYFNRLNMLLGSVSNEKSFLGYARFIRFLHLAMAARFAGINIDALDLTELFLLEPYADIVTVGSTLLGNDKVDAFLQLNVPVRGKLRVVKNLDRRGVVVDSLRHDPEALTTIVDSITNNICVKDTMEKFSVLVGFLFKQLYVSDKTTELINGMFENLKKEMRSRLNDQNRVNWIADFDSLTRANAKLDAMKLYNGLPDEVNKEYVKTFYNDILTDPNQLNATSSHFQNTVSTIVLLNHARFRLLDKAYDTSYLMTVQDWTEINAFYFPNFNKVVLPMGFLQPEIFSPDAGLAVNYGLLGFILGHEISHAFDYRNTMAYDEYGRYRSNVVSAGTTQNYLGNLGCFSKHYAQYTLNNIPVSEKTLPQNVADNGGLKLAYAAFQSALSDSKNIPVILPGLSTVSDQRLFWTSWAQTWCSVKSDNLLLQQQITDPEAETAQVIPENRVNAGAAQHPSFYEDFKCPVPESRSICPMW